MSREAASRSLRKTYEMKVAAELGDADVVLGENPAVRSFGDPFAHVLLLKGVPGEADLAASRVLAGPDGDAAERALGALGLEGKPTYSAISRPPEAVDGVVRATRLRTIVEAVDPRVVVALDGDAAEDLAAAMGIGAMRFGTPVRHDGRVLLAVDGLEASLEDDVRKRRVWAQLRSLRGVKGRG